MIIIERDTDFCLSQKMYQMVIYMASIDIGIDLGTANIIISTNKNILLDEPSVIAFNKKSKEVIAVGKKAYEMIGKTPEYINVIHPLKNGVISDYEMVDIMIKEFIHKVSGTQLVKPRIVLCVPSIITEVESRAVIEAALKAGARKVYLIHEPVAALLGADCDIFLPEANMVVDIGGGTTDIAIVSLGGVVKTNSIKFAGNKIDRAIVKFIQQKYKIAIGDKMAEKIKMDYLDVFSPNPDFKFSIKGRNMLKGLPEKIEILQTDLLEACYDIIETITENVKNVLEISPPELVGDICEKGIVLTGGGALLGGLDKYLSEKLNVKCFIAKDPLYSVVKGTVKAFKHSDKLLEGFEQVSFYKK